jgi:outer membrane protein insertion porin family
MRIFSRRLFLLPGATAIIAVFGFYHGAQAQKAAPLVEEVSVIGNRRLLNEDILKVVKTKPGEPFDWDQVQRDLQAVLALGLFDKRQTRVLQEPGQRGGVVIIFEVVELSRIAEISFKGLRHIKDTQIIDALRREHVNLEKDAVDDPDQVRQAVRVIRKFLMSRGWANPVVDVLRESVTGQTVSITFVIKREVSFLKVG